MSTEVFELSAARLSWKSAFFVEKDDRQWRTGDPDRYNRGAGPTVVLVPMAVVFIILLIAGIFACDIAARWWRETEWRRRWRRGNPDDE